MVNPKSVTFQASFANEYKTAKSQNHCEVGETIRGLEVPMNRMMVMNECDSPCNIFHDIPDLPHPRPWRKIDGQMWESLRCALIPAFVDPALEVEVAQFHVDEIDVMG
jgi:hypothetical protein